MYVRTDAIPKSVADRLLATFDDFPALRKEHDRAIKELGTVTYRPFDAPEGETKERVEYLNRAEFSTLNFEGVGMPLLSGFGLERGHHSGKFIRKLTDDYVAFNTKLDNYFDGVVKPDIDRLIREALPHGIVHERLHRLFTHCSVLNMGVDEFWGDGPKGRADVATCGGIWFLTYVRNGLLDEYSKFDTIFSYPVMEGDISPDLVKVEAPVIDSEAMAEFVGASAVLQAMREDVDYREYEAVVRARDEGLSWEKIGSALGISRQAAHARFTEKGHQAAMKSNQRLKARSYRRIKE